LTSGSNGKKKQQRKESCICSDNNQECVVACHGYRAHTVYAYPLPYDILVPQFHCDRCQCVFNCVTHSIPPDVRIVPDVLAVGGTGLHSFFVERIFYSHVITRYAHHFNASNIARDIHTDWKREWRNIKKTFLLQREANYTDAGETPCKPTKYYGVTCGQMGDSVETIQSARDAWILRRDKACSRNSFSAETIQRLFHGMYVRELHVHTQTVRDMIYKYRVQHLIHDHTFKQAKRMHIHDAATDARSRNRTMVKGVLSTIMDLATGFILSSEIVPSTK
jgi:hypothetical protein